MKWTKSCKYVWCRQFIHVYKSNFQLNTKRQLEWLNSVKYAQGSVELTSLRQAEAINAIGIYVVGKDADVKKEKLVTKILHYLICANDLNCQLMTYGSILLIGYIKKISMFRYIFFFFRLLVSIMYVYH